MPKQATTEIIRANLLEHPSVRAWRALQPGRVEPEGIEVLKEREKSVVYRLEGVGLGGSAVIAKRCQTAIAAIERTVYEEILPSLPITALHYYGFIVEDDKFCWLFLEDAGSERFSPFAEEHRALAARWLGLMHTSAARVAATTRLPDRGPGHYLEHLRSARRTILRNLTNPLLHADDVVLLQTIVAQCDVLELRWSEIEKSCDGMPSTLVHGDFRPKNVYVRTNEVGTALFPLDWETAGWGVPAADLAPARRLHPIPPFDITVYRSIVQARWSSLDIPAIQRLAIVGKIFRWLAAIHWASLGLAYEYIEKPIACLRSYQTVLAEIIRAAQWVI